MPILIIEQDGRRLAGILSGRVLIGRMAINTVVVDDRTVSRIHAWIGFQNGHYYVADSGSRTGTFINGKPVRNRHLLADGDEIYIGPVRLTYQAGDTVPPHTEEVDVSPRPAEELSVGKGLFMDCTCGAPLWMPRTFAGDSQCRYCGSRVDRRNALEEENEPAWDQEPAAEATQPVNHAPTEELNPLPVDTSDDGFDDLLEESLPSAMVPDSVEESADDELVPLDIEPKEASKPTTYEPDFADDDGPIPLADDVQDSEPETEPERPAPPAPALARPAPMSARPAPAAERPAPREAPEKKAEADPQCGVCHSAISIFEETTECPSCGLTFHSDCWAENRGCSAYGCPQVGALEEKTQS
ncbi:MAG: hypothetical protein JWP03_5064 [Phycisphaerales bacterium]|nr:hypothetical protein [Phycisphaerales bacterium]